MKRFFYAVAAILALVLATVTADAQYASTTQTISLQVQAIYQLSVTGTPSLVLTTAVAGDSLTGVQDASTSYRVTQNVAGARLTVQLSAALPAGARLYINVPSARGTSQGWTRIEDGAIHDVVVAFNRGADNQTVTYAFSGDADTQPFGPTNYTVEWTLTD